ncbi:hypothetical protein KAR91_23870, partial [Candidatus Pacearchaeota archaeon]|nr:hypothetical protein [Candidatus Pacearchaeota archaeon]
PASFEADSSSVWVGPRVGLGGVGRNLVTQDSDSSRDLSFFAHNDFNGELSTSDAKIINAYEFKIRDIVVGDDSGEWIGKAYTYNYPSPDHRMLAKAYYKIGSVAASAPIRLQVWEGIDDTGPVVFDQTYPLNGVFSANTEVEIVANGFVEFEKDLNYYVMMSSDNNFSLRTTFDLEFPWTAGDISMVREDDMLQATPYVDGDTFTQGQWAIQNQKVYECNITGVQTGTFASNSDKWDLLGPSIQNQTDAEIKTQYENNPNTNAFEDAEKVKLASLTGGRYLGVFADLTALQTAYPTGVLGDNATVTSPDGNLFYWNVGLTSWQDSGTGFIGDMNKAIYDPTAKGLDAFSMDSMVETATKKILSDTERTKLSNQSGSNSGDVTLEPGSTTQEAFDLSGQELKGNLVTPSSDGLMSQQDKTELDNISANSGGDGWVSGLDVVEDSPKGTTVLYGAGTYLINGIQKSIALAGSYDLANGFGSVDHYSGMIDDQHAIVTIYVDSAQVVKSIRGDVGEKGSTIFPALQPPDTACVAYVEIKVDKNDLPKDIDNKHIFDCRTSPSINTDETVSISADDTTTGYLFDKISLAGNVVPTIVNLGGDEKIKLDAPSGSSVLASDTYAGTSHIDGYDVTSLYPDGILWIDSTADISIQSLQNGQDGQKLYIGNLSLKRLKFENNNGTYESLMVEGDADKTADKYGGGVLIFNASKGYWYYIGLT